MSENTPIEWTHAPGYDGATWNITLGCDKISPGCKLCYAIRSVNRMAGNPNAKIAVANAGLVVMTGAGLNWTGKVNSIESRLSIPLKKKKPTAYFVNSLSDLFHKEIADEFIDKVFAVMALTPHHRYMILTKRPERMLEWASRSVMGVRLQTAWGRIRGSGWGNGPERPWPLPNVWLGVSVEDQKTANERIPLLLLTPAWTRFVSYEPALGPVNFRRIEYTPPGSCGGPCFIDSLTGRSVTLGGSQMIPKLDQVIFGGESGPGARPCNMGWARATANDCAEEKVAFFMKQAGAKAYSAEDRITHKGYDNSFGPAPQGFSRYLNDTKGGDMAEWPKWAQVRQFPEQNL